MLINQQSINWKVRCILCIYFHPNWYLNSSSQQRRFVSFSFVISLLSLSYYHELPELYTRIASGFPLRCHSEWANYFLYFHHRSCSWKTRHIDSMVFTTGGHAKCLVCKICCKHILLATILLEFICHFITNSEVWFSLHAGKGNIHIFLQKDNSSQRIRKVKWNEYV